MATMQAKWSFLYSVQQRNREEKQQQQQQQKLSSDWWFGEYMLILGLVICFSSSADYHHTNASYLISLSCFLINKP